MSCFSKILSNELKKRYFLWAVGVFTEIRITLLISSPPNYYFLLQLFHIYGRIYENRDKKGKKKTIILGTKGITTVNILLTSLLDFFKKCVPQNTNVFL